jgi:AcrR family transcriptional regulator
MYLRGFNVTLQLMSSRFIRHNHSLILTAHSRLPPPTIPQAVSSLREANCESRRQRILESARQLIAEEGPAAITMRRLATEAGLSVTTLDTLIGSQEKILTAVVVDALDQIGSGLARESALDDSLIPIRLLMRAGIAFFRPTSIRQRTSPRANGRSSSTARASNRDVRRSCGTRLLHDAE